MGNIGGNMRLLRRSPYSVLSAIATVLFFGNVQSIASEREVVADITETVIKSVVSISTSKISKIQAPDLPAGPNANFFKKFFPANPHSSSGDPVRENCAEIAADL
jgi:hypothetical protein